MDLLILGGTAFLGRHLVEAAQARGDKVTLFNRGRTNPGLYPDVERITGDRTEDLSALDGRTWDAVVDTSGYVPRHVRASAEALSTRVGHYTFVSSISVYASTDAPGTTEASEVGRLEDPTVEEVTGETYGPLKALCDEAVLDVFGDRGLVIRPGLIVGPYDPTGRFTYWPDRIAEGGDVVVPDRPDMPVQVIHAGDLAEWTLRLIDAGTGGVFNATGPWPPLRFDNVLETCVQTTGADANLVYVDESFLIDQGVAPWMELPLWLPAGEGHDGLSAVDVTKALEAGMTLRPLADTVRDTLAAAVRPRDTSMKAQLTREKEAAVLEAWRAHTAA